MDKDNGNHPEMFKRQFVCPHCGVLAGQNWTDVQEISRIVNYTTKNIYMEYRVTVGSHEQECVRKFCDYLYEELPKNLRVTLLSPDFSFARCRNCSKTSIWTQQDKQMIYPRLSSLPKPNPDIDDEIKKLYLEATRIFQDSPRASAAMLRLCVEKICRQLGEQGTLNTCIGNLVKRGLDQQIQQALDYCRVIGNNAVHPGEIDIEEDTDTVEILFALVNDIAREMITKPKELKEKYSSLPEKTKKQIEKRDKG